MKEIGILKIIWEFEVSKIKLWIGVLKIKLWKLESWIIFEDGIFKNKIKYNNNNNNNNRQMRKLEFWIWKLEIWRIT